MHQVTKQKYTSIYILFSMKTGLNNSVETTWFACSGLFQRLVLFCCFLNLLKSLIIYNEKIKEINSVKEVGIPGLNLHGFLQFYSYVFSTCNDQFEKLLQAL